MCTPLGSENQCNCTKVFEGQRCEKSKCTEKTCNNHGTCKITENDFECSCYPGYDGSLCEFFKCESENNTCVHG